jgi:hypothetical protein
VVRRPSTVDNVFSRHVIMSARLRLTRDLLLNGTHLLVTDVDNVFSRHVPLRGFLAEGYDAYHAYEMRYPTHVHKAEGLVVCSGHQFLRASPATLRFLDLVLAACGGDDKCNDQVTYNVVIFQQLEVEWDGGIGHPNRTGALRVNATPGAENANLMVESVTGRSPVTNHTIKIWDRDFAWRVSLGMLGRRPRGRRASLFSAAPPRRWLTVSPVAPHHTPFSMLYFYSR